MKDNLYYVLFYCFSGEVVGRCSLLFKVCSCPKRDKEREELDCLKNEPVATAPTPTKRCATIKSPVSTGVCKKIKMNPEENIQKDQEQLAEQQLLILQQQKQQFIYPQPQVYHQVLQ